ncbi:MAG: hypothetical protein IPJ69_04785 [Deltaproteobacteria bacterium]|nr:MAG: hypothetical protein IPJ69_04785 [Deltaproteobacteria bacterium]
MLTTLVNRFSVVGEPLHTDMTLLTGSANPQNPADFYDHHSFTSICAAGDHSIGGGNAILGTRSIPTTVNAKGLSISRNGREILYQGKNILAVARKAGCIYLSYTQKATNLTSITLNGDSTHISPETSVEVTLNSYVSITIDGEKFHFAVQFISDPYLSRFDQQPFFTYANDQLSSLKTRLQVASHRDEKEPRHRLYDLNGIQHGYDKPFGSDRAIAFMSPASQSFLQSEGVVSHHVKFSKDQSGNLGIINISGGTLWHRAPQTDSTTSDWRVVLYNTAAPVTTHTRFQIAHAHVSVNSNNELVADYRTAYRNLNTPLANKRYPDEVWLNERPLLQVSSTGNSVILLDPADPRTKAWIVHSTHETEINPGEHSIYPGDQVGFSVEGENTPTHFFSIQPRNYPERGFRLVAIEDFDQIPERLRQNEDARTILAQSQLPQDDGDENASPRTALFGASSPKTSGVFNYSVPAERAPIAPTASTGQSTFPVFNPPPKSNTPAEDQQKPLPSQLATTSTHQKIASKIVDGILFIPRLFKSVIQQLWSAIMNE